MLLFSVVFRSKGNGICDPMENLHTRKHFLFPRRVQMCRFFEEQRVDAAGKRAVTLQKFIMFFTVRSTCFLFLFPVF